jgi:hypothetical protein
MAILMVGYFFPFLPTGTKEPMIRLALIVPCFAQKGKG